EVDQVFSTQIPTTDGVELTLKGHGFVDHMGVSFSGIEARRIQIINSKLARVIAPAHPEGPASIRISIPDESIQIDEAVHYYTPLKINLLEPAFGLKAGGESIRIQDEGFSSDTKVFFGENTAIFDFF